MKRFHRAPLGAVAALALLPLTAPAQLTPERKQLNIDSFEYVWQTVRDKHWQTRPGGLDWQSVHDELRPAIEKADSMDTARGVMRDMLARLHQTHFGIIPGDFYEDWENRGARGQNGTGIDLRLVGSEVLVTSLEPGSSAAAQGIQPGWRILKIGSTDLAPLVAKLEEANRGSSLRDLLARRDLLGLLGGQTGDSIEVDFLDGSGRRVTKKLAEQTPEGTLITFGYLYPSYVWFHAARLGEGRVGYVGFNLF